MVVDADAPDDDVVVDSGEGRTVVNPSPDEEPPDVPVEDGQTVSIDNSVPGGLWLRWVLEP